MNITRITSILTLGSALTLLTACGQKDEPVSPPPTPTQRAVTSPPASVPTPPAVTAPATTPAPVVDTAPVADEAQGLIEKIQALIAAKKYPEALALLKELSAMKLTPAQQSLMADLKAQVEKAMMAQATSDPAKAASGLLGK